MAAKIQVVIDCADPNRLAEFWVQALGYKHQDPPTGFASWEEWLVANNVPQEQWNSRAAILDPEGVGPRFWFQQVPEPKTTKNRLHLDIHVGDGTTTPDDRKAKAKAEVERLVAAGATILYQMEEYGSYWFTLADPEGNEFCVG